MVSPCAPRRTQSEPTLDIADIGPLPPGPGPSRGSAATINTTHTAPNPRPIHASRHPARVSRTPGSHCGSVGGPGGPRTILQTLARGDGVRGCRACTGLVVLHIVLPRARAGEVCSRATTVCGSSGHGRVAQGNTSTRTTGGDVVCLVVRVRLRIVDPEARPVSVEHSVLSAQVRKEVPEPVHARGATSAKSMSRGCACGTPTRHGSAQQRYSHCRSGVFCPRSLQPTHTTSVSVTSMAHAAARATCGTTRSYRQVEQAVFEVIRRHGSCAADSAPPVRLQAHATSHAGRQAQRAHRHQCTSAWTHLGDLLGLETIFALARQDLPDAGEALHEVVPVCNLLALAHHLIPPLAAQQTAHASESRRTDEPHTPPTLDAPDPTPWR